MLPLSTPRPRLPLARTLLLALFVLGSAMPAVAQDVVKVYKKQRERARVQEVLDERGEAADPEAIEAPAVQRDRVTTWLEEERLAKAQRVADSLAAIRDSIAAIPPLTHATFRKVEPHEQGRFLDRFREAYWVSIPRSAGLDSLSTLHLRGRLAMLYGTPTRNAAAVEQEQYGGSEFVQFEYWFVVNDSIPIMVLDRNGPEGAGLLVAGDREDQRLHGFIKQQLARELAASSRLVSFVDYYQSRDTRQWFRAGYDGAEFFVNPIRRPRWARRIPPPEERLKWTIHR